MSLPQQTWRISADYTIPKAGSTATIAEVLAAVKAMFDAEDVIGSNYWTVSDYNGSNGTLELKRKGSPSGTLGTFRALLFGRNTPSAAALQHVPPVSQDTEHLYVCTSEDANTSGPPTSYTTDAPYSTKYCRACPILHTSSVTAGNGCAMCIVECDKMCSIIFKTTDGYYAPLLFGEIVEKYDGTGLWGHASAAGGNGYMDHWVKYNEFNEFNANGNGTSRPFMPRPIYRGNDGAHTPTCCVWDGQLRYVGTMFVFYSGSVFSYGDPFNAPDPEHIALLRIPLATRELSSPYSITYIGTLRQIKYGPANTRKIILRKADTTIRGYAVASNYAGGVSHPVYFDNEV